jgi:two-component system sensor kinase FixL
MDPRVVIGYLACYVFLDWVSYVHPVAPLGITPWNPPPALSLALLLRFGIGYWPWLFVAAFAADVIVRGAPAPWPVLVESAALLTAAYTLAARVLRQRLPGGRDLVSPRDLGVLLAVAAPTTFVVAGGYVGLYTLLGRVPMDEYLPNLFRHWVGDLNGILVFTPVLLLHAPTLLPRNWRRTDWLEALASALAIVLALWVVFGVEAADEFKFFYLLFLPLTWIAARWGLPGATLGLVAIQLGLIVAVQLGGYHAATFVQFQSLMLALGITGLVLGAVVTQRSLVEQKLRQKQAALGRATQFAAAGEMTSALAHELNQPMTALSNYLRASQTLLRDPAADRALLDTTMDKAVEQARRASSVVHRLRDFFRRGSTELREVALVQLVEDALGTVRARADAAAIQLEFRRPAESPRLVVDATQLEMVVHNLLANAIEAITASAAPRRQVTVEIETAPERVSLVVTDSGPGVAADLDVFEPFITTKDEGMGLGLAISRSFVLAHGGELSVASAPGGGARFTLTLPREPRPGAAA